MISNDAPYISVIVVGRNDDYGVNFLSRINTFIRSLDYQTRNYPGLMELIIVEWNPLDSKPALNEVVAECTNLPTRIIVVPSDVHNRINHPRPVLEFYGKNVGARRARGEFVLTTNPDVIFTEELVVELSKKQLRRDCYYRTDRYDFDSRGIEQLQPQDYISFALSRTFEGHLMYGDGCTNMPIWNVSKLEDLPASNMAGNIIHTMASGDFILASREAYYALGGLYETTEYLSHLDSFSVIRFATNGLAQIILKTPTCIFHQDHPRAAVTDFWDVDSAMAIGRVKGDTNWGLGHERFVEWINYVQ